MRCARMRIGVIFKSLKVKLHLSRDYMLKGGTDTCQGRACNLSGADDQVE